MKFEVKVISSEEQQDLGEGKTNNSWSRNFKSSFLEQEALKLLSVNLSQ